MTFFSSDSKSLPPCPPTFRCHVCCSPGHWTVACPIALQNPQRYHISTFSPNAATTSADTSCHICGKLGHNDRHCPCRVRPCASCGGMHHTRECPYDKKPEEYHQFFDAANGRCYYYQVASSSSSSAAKRKNPSWERPEPWNRILWCCTSCNVLIPLSVGVCPACKVPNPDNASAVAKA